MLAPSLAHQLGGIHQLLSSLLIGLLALHVAGVLADWLLTRENLVKAMITGRKRLNAPEAARERPLAPPWRAALVGLLGLALTAALILVTNFTAA